MAKRSGKTTEKGRYKRVRKAIKSFDDVTVEVGFFAGMPAGKKKGQAADPRFLMPDVASIQEFGSHPSSTRPKIPERSFMRTTFDKFKKTYSRTYLREGFKAALGRTTPAAALFKVGEAYRSDLIVKIIGLRQPPNADSTERAKKNNNPLIQSGLMKSSIRVRVLNRRSI